MSQEKFSHAVRSFMFLFAALGIVFMFGFFTQQSWATMWIPWELDRLASIFLASICAAVAFPVLWIARTREYAAISGGAMNLAITFGGFAAFAFLVYAANPRQPVLLFGMFAVVAFMVTLGLLWFGLRHRFRTVQPTPRVVRYAFAFFACVLVLTGGALVLKQPNIFPWPLTPQQSVLYGWIFLGASTYFLYGFVRPVWGNAQGQLIGFLAYDLILIFPFLALFMSNEPFLLSNLIFYIAVLVFSGALAAYYLFFKRETRIDFRAANDASRARFDAEN